jgi:hypothetical protein
VNFSLKISRTAAPVLLLAAALAGCGGPATQQPQVASAGGTPTLAPTSDVVGAYVEAMRAYVTCVRAEGVKVSDPDAKGKITFEGDLRKLKADPKFLTAQQKCSGLHPPVPAELEERPVLTAEEIEKERQYAKCMRENGAPDFPDPGPDGYLPERTDGAPSWNQDTEGARRAGVTCGPIIGAPATPGPAQG